MKELWGGETNALPDPFGAKELCNLLSLSCVLCFIRGEVERGCSMCMRTYKVWLIRRPFLMSIGAQRECLLPVVQDNRVRSFVRNNRRFQSTFGA
jgi:hypothetical protein